MAATIRLCRHQRFFHQMEMGFQVFDNLQECLSKKNMIPVSLAAALPGWRYLSSLGNKVMRWLYSKKNNIPFIKFAVSISAWKAGIFWKALDCRSAKCNCPSLKN